MKLKSLTLKNIGAYKQQTFDFSSKRSKQNVTLIGGKNGAGKTTFLSAMKLGLFGPLAYDMKTASSTYFKKIKGLMNHDELEKIEGLKISVPWFKIDLTFEQVESSVREEIRFVREWNFTETGGKEFFSIYKDGSSLPVSDEKRDLIFNRFCESLPPYLYDVCLFDGEEINRIIQQDELSNHLERLIKSALKLEVPVLLEDTINRVISDETKSTIDTNKQRKFEDLKGKLNHFIQEDDRLQKRYDELSIDLEELKLTMSAQKSELKSFGGLLKEEEDQLKSQLNELERKKKENKTSVQDLINGSLPFLLNRDLIGTVREQLKGEKLIESIDDVKRELLEELASELSNRISTSPKQLEQALKDSLVAIQPKGQATIHRASFSEKAQIESLFEMTKGIDLSYYKQKISDQQEMDEEIKLIKQKLTVQSDSVEDFMGMLTQLEQLQANVAEKNQELKTTTKQWGSVQEERMKLQEEFDQLREEIDREANQSSSVMHNATAMRALLLEFQNQQQRKGIQLIEKQALKMINRLFRKRGYLHRLVINSETYEVTLYAEDQKRIPQSTLSAGEKQLLLMSLVWAVFDVSGNKLPFIFDTLLGRLDVEHRENLLTELIPAFGEQVLILSTDSEVTEANYNLLKPFINKEYSLNFDTAERSIKVVPSYFRFNETEKIS